jgi:DnaJ-class molecular chaperone
VAEEVVEPIPPQPCSACRGTGVVISNLGGEPQELACPWCDGGGVTLREHDAQARWRAVADAAAL